MSSAIKSINHDRTANTLAIVFHYAPTVLYTYENVTYQRDTAFQNADSLGEYFTAKIRPFAKEKGKAESRFPFTKSEVK